MNQAIYILGGAQTDFARNWAREGLEIYDMFAEALRDGITAAGIEPAQIEVGHVGNFVGDLFTGQGLLGDVLLLLLGPLISFDILLLLDPSMSFLLVLECPSSSWSDVC